MRVLLPLCRAHDGPVVHLDPRLGRAETSRPRRPAAAGRHAPGMRQYLGSAALREQVAGFWSSGRPVGAICHGVLVLAGTRDAAVRSVLADRQTTCLPKYMERTAYLTTA